MPKRLGVARNVKVCGSHRGGDPTLFALLVAVARRMRVVWANPGFTVKPAKIYLIDDDDAVRNGLASLLGRHGYEVTAFGSGRDFLQSCAPATGSGCVLLDLKLPGMSGLSVQSELIEHGIDIPVIFMSAYATVPESVKAMKTGAADFLLKPFSSALLLRRIDEVLERDRAARQRANEQDRTRQLFHRLTQREQEVARLVVTGHTSKDIAHLLDISPRTVDHHRTTILVKLQVESIPELAVLLSAVNADWAAPRQPH